MKHRNLIEAATFTGSIDLASERVGGKALYANDEFFAEKENLLKAGRGIFIVDKYTEQGKWMDGWETRRKRVPGHDFCLIQLGIPGIIQGVDIDTNHFLGNNPAYASIDAIELDEELIISDFETKKSQYNWEEILKKVALKPGSQNIFAIESTKRWTHLRLNIYPDGGVARFRVYGEAAPPWAKLAKLERIDLAAIEHGGKAICASDMFFGNKDNLIMPGPSVNMGDGWETKRRRGPGFDWVVIKLGAKGTLEQIELDTNFFKGNYPDECWVEGICLDNSLGENLDLLNCHNFDWKLILDKVKLQPDHQHYFDNQIINSGPWSHIKLNISPDGGVSRLRIFGKARN